MVGLRPSMLSVSFIGEGALLSRAIKFSLEKKKIKIDKIFLPENNSFKKNHSLIVKTQFTSIVQIFQIY